MQDKKILLDTKFMSIAVHLSWVSKNPYEKCGAIVVDEFNNILVGSFNGKINSYVVKPSSFSYEEKDIWEHPACYAASQLFGVGSANSTYTMYTTHFPCIASVHRMIESKIKNMVYWKLHSSWYSDRDYELIKKISDMVYLKIRKFEGNLNWARDKWESFDCD